MSIDIERKHWELYIYNPRKEGSFFFALTLFNRWGVGVERAFDLEESTFGPYNFYFQWNIDSGWGTRYWKVPFSKARKWEPNV